jgi:hypothetical protein
MCELFLYLYTFQTSGHFSMISMFWAFSEFVRAHNDVRLEQSAPTAPISSSAITI